MLAKSTVVTMLPVQDAHRAGHFYTDALGLHEAAAGPDGTRYFEVGGGNAIGLRELPDARPSENTALSFEVTDITAEVGDLEKRGVRFLDYDSGDLRTVGHIATVGAEKAAWFTDTEGNCLCLHQLG
ncbi:VOC family protein [Amycolatopsis acidiphila]|uniref:VOC family protein n=1 Tax=Amycolatopsis acidiphila TaxID=715473 RepID=A0A558A2P9_9PSEU|nr:VOC family protein [Amycolatopsis acidiphila]TVT18536.1 VOC family protein [Amycolatopsis acidiphila]UIJ59386.1 VOC family protein [Amycolatopsis acidiphila]GHG80024.1 glyoxalase [Amycolatopsis acidiphila]